MKEELFNKLADSVREGGAILRNEIEPSRRFIPDVPDIKNIRSTYELSQSEFAALLGISAATLRNWEHGRRTPRGPARILLLVAAKHPDIIRDMIQPNC